MGIRGLTSFIAQDPDKYLKRTRVRNETLVIDGNCIASHLYKWHTKRDSAFGGDYDEFQVIVRSFFNLLKKCHITPIVLIDGGYEERKLKTVHSRLKNKLTHLKTHFNKQFSTDKFFPLFMRSAFCEVLVSMNVTIIEMEFEADAEIAAIASFLHCPVLSYDSDFYIYDVLYIPFSTVDIAESQSSFEEDGTKSLHVSLYDVENFLNQYNGLQKAHLPLVATLLGNDFISSQAFQKVFQQIPLSKNKRLSVLEKKIHGILNWLSHETEVSAVDKIKSLIGHANFKVFQEAFEKTKNNYNVTCSSQIKETKNNVIVVNPPPFTTKLNPHVEKLLANGLLPSFVMDIVTLRMYFMPLQVEKIDEASCHEKSLPLIQLLDALLHSSTNDVDVDDLTVYLRDRKCIKKRILPLQEVQVRYEDAILLSESEKRSYFLEVLGFTKEDISTVLAFRDCDYLFMSSFLLWCKSKARSERYVRSLLLSYFVCQAKNKVGAFRSGKAALFDIKEVNQFTAHFSPYRKTTDFGRNNYKIAIVHEFNSFQSILYHSGVLNTMLGYALTPCKIGDSYSGTLAYNLYELTGDVVVTEKLESCPNIAKIYKDYCDSLQKYMVTDSTSKTVKESVTKKKSKRSKKKMERDFGSVSADFAGEIDKLAKVFQSELKAS